MQTNHYKVGLKDGLAAGLATDLLSIHNHSHLVGYLAIAEFQLTVFLTGRLPHTLVPSGTD